MSHPFSSRAPRILPALAVCLTLGCGEALVEGDSSADEAPSAPVSGAGEGEGGKADVWGDDDRLEAWAAGVGTDDERLARASAILAHASRFAPNRAEDGEVESYRLGADTKTLAEEVGLCEDQPFADQPSVGFCSATLVAPDLVATSGHCIAHEGSTEEEALCGSYSIVFGFGYDSAAAAADPFGAFAQIPAEDVYTCKKVEAAGWFAEPENEDWALIRLDRAVVDREPVPVLGTPPAPYTFVLQIGHPSGIPQKLAPGVVQEIAGTRVPARFEGNTFSYTADLFGGNSGGGVFVPPLGALAGIPTRYSGKDFVRADGRECKVAGVCGENVSCDYAPGAYGTHAMLERLAEVNPALLEELTVVTAEGGS